MKANKISYTEPVTLVADVATEGFICNSEVNVLLFQTEVDELVNKGEDTWWLND